MDVIARRYALLVLATGEHDPLYVDAFYGPPEWKAGVAEQKLGLDAIARKALRARAELDGFQARDRIEELRRQYVAKQLDALIARVSMLQGKTMSFDEESSALYDVVAEERPDSFYSEVLGRLDSLLPGEGPMAERYDRFRADFYIPTERVPRLFKAAMDAARERTSRHVALPEDETFETEYVTGEVWSAYNWYKGNSHSLIQVNTDLPMTIDRAVSLACHEGYPGHHVYNALLERHLVRERDWLEFSVYPLYSPQSLIAEGTAEYGIELSYSPEERMEFEKSVLYPLAGLDRARAEEYAAVLACIKEIGYSSNDAARRYLDGKASREETLEWLISYALATPERAEQRLRFIEAHRSYVITYNVGEDMIRSYVEAKGGTRDERWKVFTELLSTPQTPSGLKTA